MKLGYIDQTKFKAAERANLIKLAPIASPLAATGYADKYTSFKYFTYNFDKQTDKSKLNFYFLPYGIDLSKKSDTALVQMYDNYFRYDTRPTVVVSFVGMKFRTSSELDAIDCFARSIYGFVQGQHVTTVTLLGASMGARAALSTALYLSTREIRVSSVGGWDAPGVSADSNTKNFFITLFADKHYNLRLNGTEVHARQTVSKLTNATKLSKRYFQNVKHDTLALNSTQQRSLVTEVEDLNQAGIPTTLVLGEESPFNKKLKDFIRQVKYLEKLQILIVSDTGHYMGKNPAVLARLVHIICNLDITTHPLYKALKPDEYIKD